MGISYYEYLHDVGIMKNIEPRDRTSDNYYLTWKFTFQNKLHATQRKNNDVVVMPKSPSNGASCKYF